MKYYTLLSCIESKMIHPTQIYARFELGQFPPGQAVTVANTLRRSLLSQLPGVAITLVHIENVLHEYESIPGVQEPVLDILSNLKQIVFTSDFEVFQPQIGYVHLKGPAVVRAEDLKLPFFISCVDPDQYITTLTEKGDFNLTVLINSGKHYLNHTPDSSTYSQRVALLKQQQKMVQSPTFRKSQRRFFRTWLQQRNMTKVDYLTQVVLFLRAKVNKKLLEQKKQRQFNLIKKSRVQLLTIPNPLKKRFRFSKISKKSPLNAYRNPNSSWTKPKLQKPKPKSKPKSKSKRTWGYWRADPTPGVNFTAYESVKASEPFNLKNRKQAKNYYAVRDQFFNTDGYLPINAFFSPVTKVNYTIQTDEKRAGENACFEVWTNGSIDPRRAIHQSATASIHLFLPFQLIEPKTKSYPPIDPNIRQQTTLRIRRAEARNRIKKLHILIQNGSQKTKKHFPNKEKAAEFLKGFKKRPGLKRRKSSKNKQPKWQWPRRQERRRKPLYTYIQPIQTDIRLSPLYEKKRQLFRVYRRFFPLFNILDRVVSSYNVTAVQYTKLSRLNILNLDLPFAIYKFLWQHKVQNIEDLFSIHYQMVNKAIPSKKKFAFYRAFHKAFSKYLYQWTGHTEAEFKLFLQQQKVKKKEEEKKQAKLQKAKEEKEKKVGDKAFKKDRKEEEKKQKLEKQKKQKLEKQKQQKQQKQQKPAKQKQQKPAKQKQQKPAKQKQIKPTLSRRKPKKDNQKQD